jgi:hypothetical protein
MRIPGCCTKSVLVQDSASSGSTDVVALVERGSRDTRWDGRAGAGDLEVDALGLLAVTLSASQTSCLPEGSSEHR